MSGIDYDHREEHPYQLRICERDICYKSRLGMPGNKELEEAIANDLGTVSDDIHGKILNISGKDFRIECRGCQRDCHRAPIVTIIAEGNSPIHAKVTSLESLEEQVQQVLEGTWDYPDEPKHA